MIGRILHHAETLAAVAIGLAAFLVAWPADAQLACGDRADIVRQLADKHGESQRGIGLVGPQAVMELFVSPAGTWTLLATGPQRSCLVGVGGNWTDVPAPVLPSGSPS